MEMLATAWACVTADELVCRGPCYLYGAVILASVAGGDASVYDGHEATSGHKVLTLKGDANISNPVIPPAPLYLGEGLYVDIGTNCDEVAVFYMPGGEMTREQRWQAHYAHGLAEAEKRKGL